MNKITTLEMEVALAEYLNYRANVVIPNVSWGMFSHECDLIRLTPSGYCSEIEIKVSLHDLKKDKKKRHKHIDNGLYRDRRNRIKYLYFAIPEYLEPHIIHVPDRAGIYIVKPNKRYENYIIKEIRRPQPQCNYKFSDKERMKLLQLMAMRIWGMKKKLNQHLERSKDEKI